MDVVLWGATGQAVVLAELFAAQGRRIVALFDNDASAASPLDGVALYSGVAGFQTWLASADRNAVEGLAAIGGSHGKDRLEIHALFASAGLRIGTAIHPRAFVAGDARIGDGSQILAQAAVAARAELGESCIVNTAASVDHECRLGAGVHIGPGAHLAGLVTVEDYAFVGTGAVVVPRVRIGAGSIVGAGAVVVADVAPGTVVAGNPARVLREV